METSVIHDPMARLDVSRATGRFERVIRGIGIPPCPAVLAELLAEMGKDDPDLPHVGLLIGTDAGMAAAMLKTVNSPLYGLASKATTVRRALALVGLKGAGQLVTGFYLRQAFASQRGSVVEAFWSASTRLGLISACLSRLLGVADRDEAHTFGLFRDCGMPVLHGKFPDYARIVEMATASGRRFTDVEEEACGVDHACVGAALADSWSLPRHMSQAIVWHHVHDVITMEDSPILDRSKDLMALGLVAERIAATRDGEQPGAEWVLGGEYALAHLSLTVADVDELQQEIWRLGG